MAARPRKPGRRDLPPNLYCNNGSYKYRRPDTGTWHGMGSDKTRAIAAAKTLNARLLQGPADLVGSVLDAAPSIPVGDFIDTYKTVELPPRKLSAATLELYGVRLRQVQQAWGDRPLDSITLRMVNDLLDSLTDRSSNQMRALLMDFFGYAVSKGLCPDNPAAETRVKIETKQRKRHTVEGLALIRAAAEPWLQNAIDLAMLTAQRRADLLALRWSDIRGGMIHIAQQKTTDADSDELDDLAVLPPDANAIRDMRAAVGTQTLCAALAGVDIRSWQRYEAGDKRPPPPTWGLFLLAIGQHPRGRYVPH